MIIDLSGLPASGKSYFSDKFNDAFRKNNNQKIINFIEWDRTTFFGRALHTLAYPIIRHTSKYRKLYSILDNYVTNAPQYNEAHTVDFFVTRIIFLRMVYAISNYAHTNLMVNEGISQSLIMFAIEFNLQRNEFIILVNRILKYKYIKYAVYQISLDDCIVSFTRRNRHVTQIDELRGEALYTFLSRFEMYLSICLDILGFISLSRESTFENNFNSLIEER